MSEVPDAPSAAPQEVFAQGRKEDVRHAVRRLRWFASSFRTEILRVSQHTGFEYRIDEGRLANAFVGWLRAFNSQRVRAHSAAEFREFSCFAAGLMVRALIQHEPLTASSPPDGGQMNPAHFWPEGYAYVDYCMSICSAVISQELGTALEPAPAYWDVRVWHSFRENALDDSASAIGFFELFCGLRPNWDLPSVFRPQSPRVATARLANQREWLGPSVDIG